MNKWLAWVVLSISAVAIAGCAGFGMSDRVINVGMSTNYAPLAFEKEGVVQGVEVDFANSLGEALNAKINIKKYSWEALFDALDSGEIDVVMSGVSITEKRKGIMLFTEPFMKIGQMAVIRSENAALLSSKQQLMSGRFRVGYSLNTTGQQYVVESLTSAKQIGFPTVNDGIEALLNKDIDYFIHDAPTVWRLTSSYPSDERLFGLYTPLTKEYLAWAVKKGNTELQQELNDVLGVWKKDGFLTKTLNKWIPVAVVVKDS